MWSPSHALTQCCLSAHIVIPNCPFDVAQTFVPVIRKRVFALHNKTERVRVRSNSNRATFCVFLCVCVAGLRAHASTTCSPLGVVTVM